MTLMDCTLRDGAISCHVPIIELGNAGEIGAYEVAGFTNAQTDQTYIDMAEKYAGRGSELGMFLNARRYQEKNVDLAEDICLFASGGKTLHTVNSEYLKEIKTENKKGEE